MPKSTDLSKVLKAALEIQAFCESRDWKYCFIGGLALQPWGNPRTTQDAELNLLTGFTGEEDASIVPRLEIMMRKRGVLR